MEEIKDTFEKEVTFVSNAYNPETKQIEDCFVTKTATFKELSRSNPDHYDYAWDVLQMYKKVGDGKDADVIAVKRVAAPLVRQYVNDMLILNEKFTETDKKEFLADNGALAMFGIWLTNSKFIVFFSTLTKS
jgi:hypothetical protein